MVDRHLETTLPRLLAGLALVMACSGEPAGTSTDSDTGTSGTTGGPTGDPPTTSDATGDPTGSSGDAGSDSATDSTSNPSTPTTEDPSTGDPTSAGPTTEDTTGTDATGTTDGVSATDVSTDSTSTGTTDAPGESSSSEGEASSEGGETNGCVPTEDVEVTCDQIDNDCDDLIDNVDMGNDGICDCLNIGILGAPGYAPNSNFVTWLEDQGSAVTRTLLMNNPDVVTPAFLANYDLVLVDRIERSLSPAEATALEDFVKDDGRGLITLIGYNFDMQNPVPERTRANSVLAPFGLAYEGGYFGDGVTPVFVQDHPVSMGITDVNFAGGIEPVDTGNQGTSTVFATAVGLDAGIAHQTAMMGGRVIVWGDEWITFDSDWQGFADVQQLWVQMVGWAKPQDFCGSPQ